ncbi:TetR family transcriptional regulator [Actinoplanes sp. SE50]|uniref:TetR/AcrR family transcriptional regulator n=1 Tax=unclassified Actinoplanes TaxID=2626549 RepID=UPI00023EC199|nr:MULTISPECIES: TetR/AcrR family transcriptional regulator C-terminal domain-containing protein [unclassified Actinoplanes]AEV87528.1 Tetracycline repressor protein class H [Actinoplanes sp. SE50/110]ATO85931.1 TetR family transcriptional regulator [Actinoplanes sp. SE50]SLM03345.1 TetR family transcriptional regulator [Actinoplanes sp. SE50/110]
MDFLWQERTGGRRGPKPALTLSSIADAAIAIADAEGLAAVTMQRVATDVGYTKMALYRYLPGKSELVALMLERAMGEPPELPAGDWRAALSRWCESLMAVFVGHAWALQALTGNRPVGPNEIGWMEAALACLPTGLTGAERMDTVAVLAGHARALALQPAESGLVTALTRHAARFPAVGAALADMAVHGGADQAFRFGLERILDGLETLITKRV